LNRASAANERKRIFCQSEVREYFGWNRNIAVLGLSIFGLGLGEELWQSYLPKYLMALGASGVVIGVFSSLKDLLDGLYQYPGGWIGDRYGRKRALMLFTVVAICGYVVYAVAWHWAALFLGLTLVMAWKSGAFPVSFAVIGDALPTEQRVVAFSVQSILVRVPRVIGAPLGGLLIASFGVIPGIRLSACVTVLLAAVVLVTQAAVYREPVARAGSYESVPVRQIYGQMPSELKRLLVAECIVRFGEGIAAAFIVLHVTIVLGYSASTYGLLYGLAQTVSLIMYLPSSRLMLLTGRHSLIALTFVFFALFPLAVMWSINLGMLISAFVIAGLKEIGEPARKAFIVDLAEPAHRARVVGVYYTVRNLLIVPAGVVGGLLWTRSSELPLIVAGAVSLVGVAWFLVSSRSRVY
jgi:MFS family permease